MSTSALLLMISTEVLITGFTVYFFWKVLVTPPRQEPDSFAENDEVPDSERQH